MKRKFLLLELFLLAGVPFIIVFSGFRLSESPLVAYSIWLFLGLCVRGLVGFLWNCYAAIIESVEQ